MIEREPPGARRGSVSVFRDGRGVLTLTDLAALPFTPARAFVLHDVPAGARRGGHAHRVQHEFLVVIAGRARLVVDDGGGGEVVELGPGEAVHILPRVWHELEALGEGLSVLVFAEGPYDPGDYVSEPPTLAAASAAAAQTRSA